MYTRSYTISKLEFPNLSVFVNWLGGGEDGFMGAAGKRLCTGNSICASSWHTCPLLAQVGIHMHLRALTHCFCSLVANSSQPSSGPQPGGWGGGPLNKTIILEATSFMQWLLRVGEPRLCCSSWFYWESILQNSFSIDCWIKRESRAKMRWDFQYKTIDVQSLQFPTLAGFIPDYFFFWKETY